MKVKKIGKMAIFLMPIGIAINVVGGQLAILLKLPMYLDSIGTFVVAALCGGVPGIIVGLGTQLINSITMPTLLAYGVIGIAFGFIGAFLARKKMFKSVPRALLCGIGVALISTTLAVPITAFLFGGFVGTGASAIVAGLMAAGWNVIPATFVSELSSELIDKITCFIIIFVILKCLPKRLLVKLPQGQYFIDEK